MNSFERLQKTQETIDREILPALQTLEQFVTQPRVASQIDGIDPGQAIVVFFGPPKEGKSFSVMDLTLHAAHAIEWQGCKVRKGLRVAYLVGEGINGFRVRLKAWLEHHDGVSATGEFRVFASPLSLPASIEGVVQLLQPFKPDIVVTDTLNSFFGAGDENSTQDMTTFCNAVRTVRDQVGCSVYVIHHTGHGEQGRERGSIVLRATADVLVQIAKDSGGNGLVGFQVIAARDLETMEQPISLRLSRAETGWLDENGQPLVTCIVQSADQPVTLPGRGRPLGGAQSAVLEVAQEMARGVTPTANGEVLLSRLDVAQKAKERHGLSRQSISSTWQPLAARKHLRLLEPGSIGIRLRP